MSNTAEPALAFTKARNGNTKILVVVGAPGTFDSALVERIRRLEPVGQVLYDSLIGAKGCGMAVCLRLSTNASPEEIDEAISWAILSIVHAITEYHEWDEYNHTIDAEEIRWQRGAPITTRW